MVPIEICELENNEIEENQILESSYIESKPNRKPYGSSGSSAVDNLFEDSSRTVFNIGIANEDGTNLVEQNTEPQSMILIDEQSR